MTDDETRMMHVRTSVSPAGRFNLVDRSDNVNHYASGIRKVNKKICRQDEKRKIDGDGGK